MKRDVLKYTWAINVIDYRILSKRYLSDEPTKEQLEAICIALQAMHMRLKDGTAGPNMYRHIAILEYHMKNPGAILCRDVNTVDALTAGIFSLKWAKKQAEKESEENNAELV